LMFDRWRHAQDERRPPRTPKNALGAPKSPTVFRTCEESFLPAGRIVGIHG
jgi:hypothetical protein